MEITDDMIDDLWHEAKNGANVTASTRRRFARKIIAALERDAAQPDHTEDMLAMVPSAALPVVPAPIRPPSLDVALSMCREANSEAKLPTPMCWDLALYVQRLEQAFQAPSQPGNAQQENGNTPYDEGPFTIAQQENSNG